MYTKVMRGTGYVAALVLATYFMVLIILHGNGVSVPARYEMWVIATAAPLATVSAFAWIVQTKADEKLALATENLNVKLAELRADIKQDARQLFGEEITAQLIRLDAGQLIVIRRAVNEEVAGALELIANKALRYGTVARATAAVPMNGNSNILPFAREE